MAAAGGPSPAYGLLRHANLAPRAGRNRHPRDLLRRPDINTVVASSSPCNLWVGAVLLRPQLEDREREREGPED
jgi:hypothetical protein